jgi:hypothetical protein
VPLCGVVEEGVELLREGLADRFVLGIEGHSRRRWGGVGFERSTCRRFWRD